MTPDYSKYTLQDLREAQGSIDKDRYPDRFKLIQTEIKKRIDNPDKYKNLEGISYNDNVEDIEILDGQEFKLNILLVIQFSVFFIVALLFIIFKQDTNNFSFIVLMLIVLNLIFSYQVFFLPYAVVFNKNELVFKSLLKDKRVLISEIKKINFAFNNPMYLRFTLKDGVSIRTGSGIYHKVHFFKKIKELNSGVEIYEKFLHN